MSTTRTAIQTLDMKFPSRVFVGRSKTTGIEAVDGVKITKVENGALTEYVVEGPREKVNGGGRYIVPAGNVAGYVEVPALPKLTGKGGKAEE
jgi:hypothetical protein